MLVERNRMEALLYDFKEPFILTGLTNNLGYLPTEVYASVILKNSNGYFEYPPKVGYSFNFHDTFPIGWDDGGSPYDPSDDNINFTITFDLDNQGFYAIYDVYVDAEFHTVASANESALPVGVKVGESVDCYFSTFHSFTNNINNNITIIMDPTYIVGLVTTDATLALKISFSTLYAAILIDVNVNVNITWSHLI